MPDWLSLYLVLWGLRVLEHIHVRPSGSIVFSSDGSGRCRPRPTPPPSERDASALVFANPFRLFGERYVSGAPEIGRLAATDASGVLSAYRSSVRPLHRAQLALALHLFVVVPVVWATVGITRSWPYMLGGMIALHVLTVVIFEGVAQTLDPRPRGGRWGRLLSLALSPPAATSAHLVLSKPLLREYHPVDVAALLCDEDDFRVLAGHYLRRAVFPMRAAGGVGGQAALASQDTQTRREELERVIAERLGSVDGLLASPPRRSNGARSYCPRCLTEYTRPAGECTDCEGVGLRAFAGS